MLLRNYDNIMSAIGLLGHHDQLKLGSEFGANNLNVKDINGTIRNVPNRAPFPYFATTDNAIEYNSSDGVTTLICSSNLDEPNYNDYTMTNLCDVKFVTHYYSSFEEITLDSGKKAWKRSYKILYSANKDIKLGSIGAVSHYSISNSYRHILVYKEKLPEILTIPQYTNFELSFTTIVTQNPNEPPKTEYQTEVTILDEGTDA